MIRTILFIYLRVKPDINCEHSYFRYFTDVLNILQGVYVFIIFVCKKSVLNVILGKRADNNQLEATEVGSYSSETKTNQMELHVVHSVQNVSESGA